MICPFISGTEKKISHFRDDVLIKEVPVFIDCLETECPFYNEYDEACKRARAEIGENDL